MNTQVWWFTTSNPGRLNWVASIFSASAMPTALARPWPSGPVGGLDAQVVLHLRVAGGAAAELPEVLDLLDLERVPGQIEQGVQEHRSVTIGQNEAVTVGPERVCGVVLQHFAPEHFGDIGHAHGGTGVPGVGLLDGIHGQGPDGVGEFSAGSHRVRGRPVVRGGVPRRCEARRKRGAHFPSGGRRGKCMCFSGRSAGPMRDSSVSGVAHRGVLLAGWVTAVMGGALTRSHRAFTRVIDAKNRAKSLASRQCATAFCRTTGFSFFHSAQCEA